MTPCLACSAPIDAATPYPQLCTACRATGTALALRRIEDDVATLAERWGSAVAAMPPSDQARFQTVLETYADTMAGAVPYATHRQRVTLFKRRLNATLQAGDAFARALATCWQCQDRKADREVLMQHTAFTERGGQGGLDL